MLDPVVLLALPGDFASALLLADFAPPEDLMRMLALAALLAIGLRSALALAGTRLTGARPALGDGTAIALTMAVPLTTGARPRSMQGAGVIAAP
ncbi:hypothetical protein [Rhodocyclus tenuis]|uniref:Uncharacterized protein n=1 Tax=Rhodocyclus tenuis TaxID=1066 RepID=A0A840GFI3_RHOTE|nr:hypothetical protein [Rhodocyclus tenuis]MBB4246989.1 hypothetical protein [Rhodocyclus tenuis]